MLYFKQHIGDYPYNYIKYIENKRVCKEFFYRHFSIKIDDKKCIFNLSLWTDLVVFEFIAVVSFAPNFDLFGKLEILRVIRLADCKEQEGLVGLGHSCIPVVACKQSDLLTVNIHVINTATRL